MHASGTPPLAQSRSGSPAANIHATQHSKFNNHTTLTPMIDSIGLQHKSSAGTKNPNPNPNRHMGGREDSSEQLVSSQLRSMVANAMAQNLHSSAIFFAEKLARINCASTGDAVLYAKTHYSAGEHRRCLAVLEQKGLLSAESIVSLSSCLRPVDSNAAALSAGSSYHGSPINGKLADCLSAAHLASLCLLSLEQYEDCLTLLEPLLCLDDEQMNGNAILIARSALEHQSCDINTISAVYCAAGRCFDCLENGSNALKALLTAIRIDASCVEALDLIIKNSMMSSKDRAALYYNSVSLNDDKWWLDDYYRFMLLDTSPEVDTAIDPSPILLIRKAEYLFERHQPEEAYRLSRLAYTIDPFYWQGLLVYIASMADLQLKTELFYLGHELANTYPKMAVSWYAVGVYYWCCRKLDMAQKYLMKATKMDKKFAKAWIALGHVLGCQEESELAISAFRTACRLLPGDHRPLVFMAKELFRTNYLSLALHILSTAYELAPSDASVLNELGVIHMKLNRLEESIDYLAKAVTVVQTSVESNSVAAFRKGHGEEVFNNYATVLRKYDAGVIANLAFTYHLMQCFDDAIHSYHQALAINPTYTFVSEMLNRAISQDRPLSFGSSQNADFAKPNNSSSSTSNINMHIMHMTSNNLSRSRDDTELTYNLSFDSNGSSILSDR